MPAQAAKGAVQRPQWEEVKSLEDPGDLEIIQAIHGQSLGTGVGTLTTSTCSSSSR